MRARRWHRSTAAVLSAALGADVDAPADPDLGQVATAAAWHGISGYVATHLLERGHSRPALAPLLRVCRAAARAHLSTVADLAALDRSFRAAGVPYLVVKGPVLAEGLHGQAALRGYGDLDVLVAPQDLAAAVGALEGAGATVLDRNWELLARRRMGQLHLRTRRDGVVDLHWHLVNVAPLRDALTVDTAALLDRSVTVPIGPVSVPTTDPIDTAVHLAQHLVVSGADRLIWYADLDRALARVDDWDAVVRRARDWGAALYVGTALASIRTVLGTDVPDAVVRALVPSAAWRATAATAPRLSPPARLAGHPSLHRMVSYSASPDAAASLRTLAGRAARHLTRTTSAAERDEDALYDPTNPDSTLWPAGLREDYFAVVAREGAGAGPR